MENKPRHENSSQAIAHIHKNMHDTVSYGHLNAATDRPCSRCRELLGLRGLIRRLTKYPSDHRNWQSEYLAKEKASKIWNSDYDECVCDEYLHGACCIIVLFGQRHFVIGCLLPEKDESLNVLSIPAILTSEP